MRRFLLSLLVVFVTGAVSAQYSLVGASYPLQDFNGLGLANATPAGGDLNLVSATLNGWYFLETGSGPDGTIVVGTGSSNTGTAYNFGSTAAADRTLGGLQSGTQIPTIGFYVTNNTGAPITALAITYTGEQWRLGTAGRVDRMDFQYSTDATSLTTGTWTDVDLLDFTAPVTTVPLGALNGNLSANKTLITFAIVSLSIGNGTNFFIRWNDFNGTGADDGLGVDDFSFTATLGSSNTITTGAVFNPPFILVNCLDDETGTVAFTSTGSFTLGNTYTAQLSDDIGSFASPTVIGTLVDNTNAGTINITIPAGTPGGTGYLIRVISDNPSVTGSSSAVFTITQGGFCNSSHTDYYRSIASGNWNNPLTWESSPDNLIWISPATLAPTFNANTILVRNGHAVTISSASSADQLTIQSGGILNHSNGVVFTLNDGSGVDLIISSGGTYILNGTQPSGIGTVDVQSGALVRIDDNSVPADSDDFAFGNANVTFNTGCTFEWNTILTPSWTGRFYFTSGQNTKYKFSVATGSLGGASPTIVYGHLEANANLTFINAGPKTFVNGIIGTGNITASAAGSGAVIIDGTTSALSVLGGGTLTLQSGVPLQITSTTTTMTSSKVITGDVQLSGSLVVLGNFDLTVSGSIGGYGSTTYIQTNGTGYLKMNAVGGTRVFPVGYSNLNAVYINNGGGSDYSVRVENGINPAIAFPTYGINRTWNIFASVNTSLVEVTFWYYSTDANAGALPQPQPMEILLWSGAWSVTPLNVNINPAGGDPYTVTTTAAGALTIGTTATPYALGKNGGWILPIDCIISTRAQKRNNTGIISWTVNSCSEVRSFEVQRSVNNSGYQTIGTVSPVVNQTDFSFTDIALAGGRNLYRIKVNGFATGSSKYSNTVVLIHNSNDILISSLAPNPVHNIARLTVSTGRNAAIDFKIYNASGSLVKQWSSVVTEGNNSIEVNAAGLAAGVYTVFASSNESKTVSRFVKQ